MTILARDVAQKVSILEFELENKNKEDIKEETSIRG